MAPVLRQDQGNSNVNSAVQSCRLFRSPKISIFQTPKMPFYLTSKRAFLFSPNVPMYPVAKVALITDSKTGLLLQVPKENSWDYVLKNFERLAHYWGHKYAVILKDPVSEHDHTQNILMQMVSAYEKYFVTRNKRLSEMQKIIKAIPAYYYQNEIRRKHNNIVKLPIEKLANVLVTEPTNVINVSNFERFMSVYDNFYEEFLRDHYKLGKRKTPEVKILLEIMNPSREYCKFMAEREGKAFLSITALKDFFLSKKAWTRTKFYQAYKRIKFILRKAA